MNRSQLRDANVIAGELVSAIIGKLGNVNQS